MVKRAAVLIFLNGFEARTINRNGDLVVGRVQVFLGALCHLFFQLGRFGGLRRHLDFVQARRANMSWLQVSVELLDLAAQFPIGGQDELLVFLHLLADFDGFGAFPLYVLLGRLDLLYGAELTNGRERLLGVGLAHLLGKVVVLDLFYFGLQVQLVPDLRILVKAGVAHRQLLVFDGYGLDATLKLLRLDESGGVHKFMHR